MYIEIQRSELSAGLSQAGNLQEWVDAAIQALEDLLKSPQD
ncbi:MULTISPECIES: hypothetical protein [Photobacterium]|nr:MULTISPECIES: hypothetical protein [Photobacterium]MDO6580139.1 hypothetical protein [Photobacterium sp. 2_MG-2023]